MLVFGDWTRRVLTRDRLAALSTALARAHDEPAGLGRHAALIAALIAAGELAQGIADARFAAAGAVDTAPPEVEAAMRVVSGLARAVARSWRGGFDARVESRVELDILAMSDLPDSVEIRQPEGFAFYAVYPELYLEAAESLRGEGEGLAVVGLRSIGTTLAAVVAAGLESAALPVTVRPVGHPFSRRLSVSASVRERMSARGALAIVDEGPGLSGSSVTAVANTVAGAVPPERVHIFPSHGNGPGPEAGPVVRAVWKRARTHLVTFDDAILAASDPRHRLATWVADLVGPLSGPLQEVSAGGWRRERWPDETAWPPAHPWQERRKFLAESASGRWLVKFAGLGEVGRAKLDRARHLAAAGFTPEPAGLCHGFLVERWLDGIPLGPALPDRARVVGRIGRYLGRRATMGSGAEAPGAGLADLVAMARHNTAEALGADAAGALDRWPDDLDRLAARARPVAVDGRLHLWEWLLRPDGTLLKTDALDHAAGHDLVGHQDIAWDVAGAAVEFALAPDEAERLRRIVGEAAGREVAPDLVAVLRVCYAAFQLGLWTMARAAASGAETGRIDGVVQRYRAALRDALPSRTHHPGVNLLP